MSEAMRCKYISILHVYSEPGAAVTPISDKGLVESDSISALRRLILANLSWQSEITTHRLASSRSYINCAKKTWAWIWRWTSSSSSSTMVLVVLHFSSPRPTVSESTDMSPLSNNSFQKHDYNKYKVVHIFFRARFAGFRARFAQFRARFATRHVAKNYQNHPTQHDTQNPNMPRQSALCFQPSFCIAQHQEPKVSLNSRSKSFKHVCHESGISVLGCFQR